MSCSIPTFSTNKKIYLRFDKIIQDVFSNYSLMDSRNLPKMVLEYIYPITKRYLYSINVSVDFKQEVKQGYGDFCPIDFYLLILAKDELEAALELSIIVKKFHFFEDLDFSIEKILQYKQRYQNVDDPTIGFIKQSDKIFYTTKSVILFHSESQISDEEIYRYRKNKNSRKLKNYKSNNFPVEWFN